MKALWLREVRQVLERDDFRQWWKRLHSLAEQRQSLTEQVGELHSQINLVSFRAEATQKEAIDALYLAGEYEDQAARLRAEAAEIENKSYEAVANFENQRIMVSDIYSRMGAVEHRLLNVRSEVGLLTASLQKSREGEQRAELQRALKRKQSELGKVERELAEVSAYYERENKRKMSLWEEVEHLWGRSLDINLGVAERRVQSKRSRQKSERLFRQAEAFKNQVAELKAELEKQQQALQQLGRELDSQREAARHAFDCLVGEEFIYWPSRERDKAVYCIPLADHDEGYNIELKALNIYLIDQQRGVEFIEPLPPEAELGGKHDSRIDDFFRVASKERPDASGD